MTPEKNVLGEALRRLRRERQLSLAAVAQKAGISVATLSRVETAKQSMDVDLLTTLARILGVPATEILGTTHDEEDPNTLIRRLAKLRPAERAKLLLGSSRRRSPKELRESVDDLLATIDLLRDELLSVQRTVRRKK